MDAKNRLIKTDTLGLIAAAISGYTSESEGVGAVALAEQVSSFVTAPMIAQEATLLHFARVQGIGDAMRETGIPFPDPMNEKLEIIQNIVAEARTELTAYNIDMAYSSGYLDAMDGGWDVGRLNHYATSVFQTEKGIMEISDAATLRWAVRLGLEEGRALITGAIAVTVTQDPYQPIWSGTVEDSPYRGAAFIEVSSAVRLMLDEMHEAAYVSVVLPVQDCTGVADPFQDTPPSNTCSMEI